MGISNDSFDTTWTVSLKFGELTRKHWDVHVKNSDEKVPKNMCFFPENMVYVCNIYIYNMYIYNIYMYMLPNSGLCNTVFFTTKGGVCQKTMPLQLNTGAPQAGHVPIRSSQVGRNQIPFNLGT